MYNKLACQKGSKWGEESKVISKQKFDVDCTEKGKSELINQITKHLACHPSLIYKIDNAKIDVSVPKKIRCIDKTKELM